MRNEVTTTAALPVFHGSKPQKKRKRKRVYDTAEDLIDRLLETRQHGGQDVYRGRSDQR